VDRWLLCCIIHQASERLDVPFDENPVRPDGGRSPAHIATTCIADPLKSHCHPAPSRIGAYRRGPPESHVHKTLDPQARL
jgi:hypothetical protein